MHNIISNKQIATRTYEMKLQVGVSSTITNCKSSETKPGKETNIKSGQCVNVKPGQFVNIKVEGFYLRRPFAICDWDQKSLTIVYKIVGGGTKALSKLQPGEALDLLYPLGNGFTLQSEKNCSLIGGSLGIAPLYGLAKALSEKGVRPEVILGFASKGDVFYEKEFKALGLEVKITTEDGSYGTKGLVTDVLEPYDYVYACGPEPMLKAISDRVPDGQFSFEARMACGFGGCMGCTCQTKYGPKRICKEGPVLTKEEILW